MKRSLFFLFLIFMLTSCTPALWNKFEIYNMSVAADPKFEYILPDKIDSGVKCSDYGEGCLSAHQGKTMMVKFVALEFASAELAKKEAYRIDGYYANNWVFEDVVGEPVLERFVQRAFKAKKGRVNK